MEQPRPIPHRRKFLFVDNQSNTNNRLTTNAKAHIASESNRQKRLRQVEAHRRKAALNTKQYTQTQTRFTNANANIPTIILATPYSRGPGSSKDTISSGRTRSITTSASTASTSPASDVLVLSPQSVRARTLTPPSPILMVERQLIDMDPFLTMPAKLNRSAKSLVGLISPMFMETSFCSAQWGETFITSFGLSLWYNNECKLFNMLESISAFVDQQRGRDLSQETLRWRNSGIQSLNGMIANPKTRYGNDVLMGITGLMHSQTVYDSDSRLQMHVHSRGMAQVLKHRGGLEGLDLPPSIEGYISVVSITSSKAQIAHLNTISPGPVGVAELEDWVKEVDFVIDGLTQLSQWRDFKSLGTNDFTEWQYQILSKLVDPLNWPANDVQESHQMFILTFLALTKWEYRDQRHLWMNAVFEVEARLRALGQFCSLPNVSWMLMDVIDKKTNRKWRCLRVIKILHRLPVLKRIQVKELLFALITGNILATTLTRQEIDELREDFMAGLPRTGLASGLG